MVGFSDTYADEYLDTYGVPISGTSGYTVSLDPPSVHFVFESADLPVGTVAIQFRRTYSGVTETIRDGVMKPAVGGVILDDFETPLGVDVVYQGTLYDSTGAALGTTDPITVNIPVSEFEAWISDPRDATSPIRVELRTGVADALSRPTPGNRYQVGFKTIVLAGQTQLLTDLPMDFVTQDATTRDNIVTLMGSTGGLVLIRTSPMIPVPRLLYCWASNPVAHPLSLAMEYETYQWDNTVQEITEIPGSVVVHTVTWQTYMDAFPTWGNMAAAYTTWFDAKKNPPGGV